VNEMRRTIFALLSIALFSTNAHASGDPAVVYFFFGGVILQILGLLAYLLSVKQHRLLVASAYLAFFALVWPWALNTHSLSPEQVGWILVGLPVLLMLLRWGALRLGR
jgi:hypothetical protein